MTNLEPHQYPLEPRLKRISQIYVRHGGIENAWETLEVTWKHGLRLKEAAAAMIIGESRCGKSETLKRFISEKSGSQFHSAEERGSALVGTPDGKIVYLDTTNGATPLTATVSLLTNTLIVPRANRFKEHDAAEAFVNACKQHEVRMLIIDEAQQLFRNQGPSAIHKFASWILAMENSRQFRIVLCGSPLLEQALAESTLNWRKSSMRKLLPFAYKTAAEKADFRSFLETFGQNLPFLDTPVTNPDYADRFFFATRGRVGALAKLCETATIFACDENEMPPARLKLSHFARAFDYIWGDAQIMEGFNPFASRASLPTHPLNLDEEMAVSALPRKKRPGRQRAAMLRSM